MKTYSKAELQEKAKEVFKANKCKKLIATKDGNFFLENKANHALNHVRETFGRGSKLEDFSYELEKVEKAEKLSKKELAAQKAAEEKANKGAAAKKEVDKKAADEKAAKETAAKAEADKKAADEKAAKAEADKKAAANKKK